MATAKARCTHRGANWGVERYNARHDLMVVKTVGRKFTSAFVYYCVSFGFAFVFFLGFSSFFC